MTEHGALDDMTYEEVMSQFAPSEDDEVPVSRMRDGRQAKFTERFIRPLVQQKIDQAEAEGVSANYPVLYRRFSGIQTPGVSSNLSRFFMPLQPNWRKNGILVPEPDQVEQAYHTWGKSGISIEATSASLCQYLEFES